MDEAIQYYNQQAAGLGDDFLTEVLDTLDRIARFPEAWHACSSRTRRCQTRRFPYGIIYQVRKTEFLVIAIANLHREPDYWEAGLFAWSWRLSEATPDQRQDFEIIGDGQGIYWLEIDEDISVEDLLGRPEEEFQRAASHVLKKNEELYRRLA